MALLAPAVPKLKPPNAYTSPLVLDTTTACPYRAPNCVSLLTAPALLLPPTHTQLLSGEKLRTAVVDWAATSVGDNHGDSA